MRFKNLLFGLASTAMLGGLVFFGLNQNTDTQKQSNVFQNTQMDKGIRGAINYYHQIKANPLTGTIDVKDVRAARNGVMNLSSSKALNMQWQEMGPSNVGGRTRAILFDNANPAVMYAGGVSGGLWKSTTNGQSWSQISLAENIAVTCIAQAPDGTIYVGTGEGLAQPSGTNYNSGQYGDGVYKSTDGTTFNLLTNTSGWTLINRIAVDKNNKVFLATSVGCKSSSDAGVSWNNSKPGPGKDIKIAPNSTTAVLSINGTVFIGNTTTDTWVQQTELPNNSNRVEIGISPTDENYIYAMIVNTNGSLNSIWRTTNKGTNWSKIGQGTPTTSTTFKVFGSNKQGWYDAAVMVSATNPDIVYIGGISIWKGQKILKNAPFSWTQISSTTDFYSDGTPNPHYVHADVHALVQNPSNDAGFFIGCDGGIFESSNNGASFIAKNINYAVTQFYAVACSPNGWAMGGTQDNSTPYVDGHGNNPKEARVLYGGDGGWAAFSSLSQKIIFATSQYAYTGRSNDNGETWQRPTMPDGTTPAFFSQPMLNEAAYFVTPLLIWETTNFPNSIDSVDYVADTTYAVGDTLYARSLINDRYPFPYIVTSPLATKDIIRIQDPIESRFFIGFDKGIYMTDQALHYSGGPPRWYKIVSLNGTVMTMSISKDGDILYFGSGNTLYRASNLLAAQDSTTADVGGASYAIQVAAIKNFSGIVTSIGVDPTDANRVAVTLGGFSSSYPHVYYSQNATAASPSFAAKRGDLPSSLPVYACLIPMQNSNTVLIGTEYGIYGTENINSPSPTWTNQNTGVDDPVPVFMLRQQIYQQPYVQAGRWDKGHFITQSFPGIYNYGEIYAATHGRGLFKSMNYVGFKEITGKAKTFKSSIKLYPNPVKTTATIDFELTASETVTGKIYDVSGRFVKDILFGSLARGQQHQNFEVSDLSSGIYILQLTAGNETKTSKFIVK